MSKNTVILSVSIPIKDAQFLDEQAISPSGILQDKIKEIKQFFDAHKSENSKLHSNIKAYQTLIIEMQNFLDSKGLKNEEFIQWRGKHVLEQQKE